MTVIRSWSGDGLAAGTLTTGSVGTGDAAFNLVSQGPFAIATSGGTRSPHIVFPDTAAAHQVRWSGLGNLSSYAIRRYFRISALPSSAWGLFMGYSSGGADLFRVEINSTGLLRLRSASAAVYSPSTNHVQPNTDYRVELTGTSDGLATVYLYEGESETPILSGSGTVTAGQLDEVRFGHNSSTTAVLGETMDDLAVANEAVLIGPVDPEEPTGPVEGVIRQWSGNGLSVGAMTVASVGTDDTAFNLVSSNDFALQGGGLRAPRVRWPASNGAHQLRWNNLGALTTWSVRRYFSFDTLPASTWSLMEGRSSSNESIWRIEFNAAGLLRLRNASSATYSATGSPLAAGKTYRVEIVGNSTTGMATVRLFEGDYSTLLVEGTAAIEQISLDEVRFGPSVSATLESHYGDDFAVSNLSEWIGPVVDAGPQPGANVLRSWAGTGLSAGTMTTATAGAGDTAFEAVTGGLLIENQGLRAPRIRLPDSAAVKRMNWWPIASPALTNYAVRWYVVFGGPPGAEAHIASGHASGDRWSVRMTAAGILRIRDDSAGVIRWNSTSAVQFNVLLRFEAVIIPGQMTLKVYRSDYPIVLEQITVSLNNGAIDELRFGTATSVATNAVSYDDIVVSSEAIEIGAAASPPPPYTHFRKNSNGDWVPQDFSIIA